MDTTLTQKMLAPFIGQLKRLSVGLGMPFDQTGLDFSLIRDTPIVQSLSRLQEIPSEETVADADFLIDLLIPFYSNPLLPAGYGAIYLPDSFWQQDLGRYLFKHYLFGLPSLFVVIREAQKRFLAEYKHDLSRPRLNSLVGNRVIPSYLRIDDLHKSLNNRYVRLDHIGKAEEIPGIDPSHSQVKTAFPPHIDNLFFPWQRTLFALRNAFGLPGPSDVLDPSCKIVRSLNSVVNAVKVKSKYLREATADADYLVDILVTKGVYEIPVSGWGAAYVDLSFWSWEAGETIMELYKNRFGPDLLTLTDAVKILRLSNSQRMQIYLHIRNREFPSYPVYSSRNPVQKKIARLFRRDHAEYWRTRHTKKKMARLK